MADKKVKEHPNKTLEEQIWDEIVSRIRYFTARQIALTCMTSTQYVRLICEAYYKRGVLDKKVKDKTNYYRIKL